MVTSWKISLEHIQNTERSAADMLALMIMFDKQGTPRSLLHGTTSELEFEDSLAPSLSFTFLEGQDLPASCGDASIGEAVCEVVTESRGAWQVREDINESSEHGVSEQRVRDVGGVRRAAAASRRGREPCY